MGAAGFGAPVAITAGMLVGLGFNPLYAVGICLIANTAPVAFGGIGIPIITAGKVTGMDPMVVSKMIANQLPLLSFIVPFWLIAVMSGWKGKAIVSGGKAIDVVYHLNWLSAAGTAILFASVVSAIFLKVKPGQYVEVFSQTLKNLRFPLMTIASVLGFAYLFRLNESRVYCLQK